MSFARILVTGGAGFVGSNLALRLKRDRPGAEVIALDNLLRRGSEANLPRLREHGVEFRHGDIRCREDLEGLPDFDLLIECSAEPSVHAGASGSPATVVQVNLAGTANCLEAARRQGAAVLFLSTSRVYPIARLRALGYEEGATRLALAAEQVQSGASDEGVSEDFALAGARSFYGATKLASELLIQEYVFNSGMRALVYRAGVIAGPWQMGRVDQGFVSLWVARHHFGRPLRYVGFGGGGKQVRDVLHIDDLGDLVLAHLSDPSVWDGRVYNVGGGKAVSTSLLELTALCREATGRTVPIDSEPATSPVDVPIYLSDCARVMRDTAWRPRRGMEEIVRDVAGWLAANGDRLEATVGV